MKSGHNEKPKEKGMPLVRYAETTALYTISDLRTRYGGKTRGYWIYTLVSRLKRQGRIQSVCPGVYAGGLSSLSVDRYAVPSKLRPDAVISFHTALEFHGVGNQVFQTVYYQSARPRNDVVFDQVTYRRVSPFRKLLRLGRADFQVETARDGLQVTQRERSLVDCLAALEYSGGIEELDRCLAMFPSFDFEAALNYLNLQNRPWLYARLGYLLDRHAKRLFFAGKSRDAFLRRVPPGLVYLEKKSPGCRWIATWNLMVPPTLVVRDER